VDLGVLQGDVGILSGHFLRSAYIRTVIAVQARQPAPGNVRPGPLSVPPTSTSSWRAGVAVAGYELRKVPSPAPVTTTVPAAATGSAT
jgi:hypothetical protein